MTKNTKHKPRISSLTVKFAVLVTLVSTLMLAAVGFYFDNVLKDSFRNTTETRMKHGFERLAYNIRTVEKALKDGITFINSHDTTLASIELINHYEHKTNYNTFFIDEEKKTIAEALLTRVKLSFNSDISLYNQNNELIAYVSQGAKGYHLNFISYSNGLQRLMRRHESERTYSPVSLKLLNEDRISLVHPIFYTENQIRHDSVITYHHRPPGVVIKSHMSLFEDTHSHFLGYIEMSRHLDKRYFKQLSDDLNISLNIEAPTSVRKESTGSLFDESAIQNLPVRETKQEYVGSLGLQGVDHPIYFKARFERETLNKVLEANRQQLLFLLVLVAIITLLIMHIFITRGLERPLKALMNQIKRIEQQDYTPSQPLTTGDELETVSVNINRLAETVRDRERSLENSKSEMEFLSNHDALTNLPNRRYFGKRLERALKSAQREQTQIALFFIDLDQFKQVNDTQGHNVGDDLLVQVSNRLRRHVNKADTLARIGGDEFNILIEGIGQVSDLESIAADYLSLFTLPFTVHEQEISISASIGIALYPLDGHDNVALSKSADLAMFKAKDSGRNNYCFFSGELFTRMKERADMTHALKDAITKGDQFTLFYQPKISTSTGQIISVEALIRWNSPTFGFVSPDRFIPLAEELGFIIPIGEWVLEQGCSDYMRLKEHGIALNHIGINVSNVQLDSDQLLPNLVQIMKKAGISPTQLELEITESYISSDINEATATLKRLREMGLHLAIDDFGTGYSAMSSLQKLPITRLKIDKAFVDGLPADKNSVAITRAIINLAKNFGLSLTAEGVENKEQLDFLVAEGCDEIQGYYYAKPLPFDDLVQYCRATAKDNVIMMTTSEHTL